MAKKETMKVDATLVEGQANAQELAQPEKVKVTQTTISKAQENRGGKEIIDMTSQLSQVLKQFGGLYDKELKECNGLTVEGWMAAHGVYRVQTKTGIKKGYTPASLKLAWHKQMKEEVCNTVEGKKTKLYWFKNVAAKYKPELNEVRDWGLKDENVSFRVFTREEAEKIDGKPISMYKLCEIEDTKWSVRTIINGLKQRNNFDKENEKASKTSEEWDKLKEVCIVRFEKQEGKMVRVVVPVKKNLVTF